MIEEEEYLENDAELKHLLHLCKNVTTCSNSSEKELQVSNLLRLIQNKIKNDSAFLHPSDVDRMNKLCLIIRNKIYTKQKKR